MMVKLVIIKVDKELFDFMLWIKNDWLGTHLSRIKQPCLNSDEPVNINKLWGKSDEEWCLKGVFQPFFSTVSRQLATPCKDWVVAATCWLQVLNCPGIAEGARPAVRPQIIIFIYFLTVYRNEGDLLHLRPQV